MDILLSAIVGMLLGGIINLLADDLPAGRLPGRPRYRDGSARPPLAWLGVSAFLFQLRHPPANPPHPHGDARGLSWRYPATELALATLIGINHHVTTNSLTANDSQLAVWQLYVVLGVLIAVVDIERRIILSAPLSALALGAFVDAVVLAEAGPAIASAMGGALCGSLVFAAIYCGGLLYVRIKSRRQGYALEVIAFGKGDVYLMTVCGLIVGFPDVILAMLLALLLGGVAALFYIAAKRTSPSGYEPLSVIPYGPAILAATYITWLFGNEIARLFL